MKHYENRSLENIRYFCELDLIWKVEQWMDVVGYEGLYMVSDLGRVKSLDRYVSCIGNSFRFNKGIVLKNRRDKLGYLRACINNNKKYFLTIHRLVSIAFIENKENLPCVNHINGIKQDNRIINLEWVTHKENTIHSFKIKLQTPKTGASNGMAKLTEKQVLEIRENKSNFKTTELSILHSISKSVVRSIILRKSWTHI